MASEHVEIVLYDLAFVLDQVKQVANIRSYFYITILRGV